MPENKKPEDDGPVGFNLNTQKLHCLIVLDDRLASKLSDKAGEAFFRAFIVEDRKTGEIMANMRFRYKDHDSWFRICPDKEKQRLSTSERIEYLAGGVEKTQRTALMMLAKGKLAPKEAITRHYPPEPENSEATMDWLIAQDLVQLRTVTGEDGREILVSKEGNA
jgi:hypothetical protein